MTAIFNPTTMILPGVKIQKKTTEKPEEKSPRAVFSRSFAAFSCFIGAVPTAALSRWQRGQNSTA